MNDPQPVLKPKILLHTHCGGAIEAITTAEGALWRCPACDVTVGCRLNIGTLDIGLVRDE